MYKKYCCYSNKRSKTYHLLGYFYRSFVCPKRHKITGSPPEYGPRPQNGSCPNERPLPKYEPCPKKQSKTAVYELYHFTFSAGNDAFYLEFLQNFSTSPILIIKRPQLRGLHKNFVSSLLTVLCKVLSHCTAFFSLTLRTNVNLNTKFNNTNVDSRIFKTKCIDLNAECVDLNTKCLNLMSCVLISNMI